MIKLTKYTCSICLVLVLTSCAPQQPSQQQPSDQPITFLPQARQNFKTTLVPQARTSGAAELPPANLFQLIQYPAPSGDLVAYLSPNPGDRQKHPAIIWITGGDCNSIGDVWSPAPRENDQTAAAYRQAGIVMMFPSLRGGNDNPGVKEGWLGEVDDVLAALKYLEKQDYVDPRRIYLGGHSTGGTLALLVAESSKQFRAVFSFGPIDDVSVYSADSGFVPFDLSSPLEVKLRSPIYWLSSIQSPTWIFEGTEEPSNLGALDAMAKASTNPQAKFIAINGTDHFDILAPMNEMIAQKILQDTGESASLSFSDQDINQAFSKK
jgi:dipeptidyl aminopeptidase/acylaminoacyl peptidase